MINRTQPAEQHVLKVFYSFFFVEMRVSGFYLKQVYTVFHYVYVVGR